MTLKQVRRLNEQATKLQQAGKLPEAITLFDQAIKIAPDLATTHFNRANALFAYDDLSGAMKSYRQTIALDPTYIKAHINIGILFTRLNRNDDALLHLKIAVDEGSMPVAQLHLARALLNGGMAEQALPYFNKHLKLEPADEAAHMDTVTALAEQGLQDEALEHVLVVLARSPEHTRAWSWRMRLDADSITPENVRHLETMGRDKKRSALDRRTCHFALGRLFDQRGDYDRAFANFRSGNLLKNATYNPRQIEKRTHSLIETVDEKLITKLSRWGSSSTRPIFIIGMPRSGTTLTEQILASHPNVHPGGELDSLRSLSEVTARRFDKYPEGLARWTEQDVRVYAHNYLDRLTGISATTDHITDKWPTNFLHLGMIASLFPNARIVHCTRDPLDVCLSCYFQNFQQVSYSFDLSHLGHFYRNYQKVINHWHDVNIQTHEFSYEALVENQEDATRALIGYCGLDWHEGCLNFHKTPGVVQTASLQQVREPLYSRSLGRWRNYEKHIDSLMQTIAR
ncbi:MAG: sulfotransferase [Gammaproteobacteria bacterium]|nr:sulfotransferase [Gammaproteobacteria bacterium]